MRLTGWNAAHLSFAGRVTLAQSVIQAMPIYAMQTTLLPSSVWNRIDKSCRRFIWDGNSKTPKMSIVGWDKVCLPKNHGGLGFKKLEAMNQALLMKINWGVISNSDKWWVKVICSKYGLDIGKLPLSLHDKPGSRIWMAIRKTWAATVHGARWSISFAWEIEDCSELAKRHIPVSNVCDRCGVSAEDILHVLRDCCCIKRIWIRLVLVCNHYTFFHSSLRDWLVANLHNKWKIVCNVPWECIFGVAVWRLWIWRNHFIFGGELVDNTTIYLDIMARANEIQRVNNPHISQQPRRKEMFIGWSPPPWPWCKLNTDGSYKNARDAGAGGILRDSFGYWILGFCMKIKESSVTVAEL
ncbi:putative ribonuclease H protein [Citrus sinensis]|nr:putative ribonuclease H protein [Citrus sinensis]